MYRTIDRFDWQHHNENKVPSLFVVLDWTSMAAKVGQAAVRPGQTLHQHWIMVSKKLPVDLLLAQVALPADYLYANVVRSVGKPSMPSSRLQLTHLSFDSDLQEFLQSS